MATGLRWARDLAIGLGILAGAIPIGAKAQAVGPYAGLFQGGMQAPQVPRQGDWVEVVTVTSKWLVIQNHSGQQFPVATDSIAEFVIRWPIDPARITAGALIEAYGLDLGSHQIRTDSVDVFEGGARNLVQPMALPIVGVNNRFQQLDFLNPNNNASPYPMLPGNDQVPNRLHVVGSLLGLDPLRLAMPGNSSALVLPGANGLTFRQVTLGSLSYLKPHDLLYVVPNDVAPKTLILGQVVAYKAMPIDQFVP